MLNERGRGYRVLNCLTIVVFMAAVLVVIFLASLDRVSAAGPEPSMYVETGTPGPIDPTCPWLAPGYAVGDLIGPGDYVVCPSPPTPDDPWASPGPGLLGPADARPAPTVVGIPRLSPAPTLPPTDT